MIRTRPLPRRWMPALPPLLLLVVIVLLGCCIPALLLASARTVTWTQSGGGNLQAPENWDSNAVPGAEDDVVIRLQDAPGFVPASPISSAASAAHQRIPPQPWESGSGGGGASSISSGGYGGGSILTLMQGWSVRSLSLSGGGASLVVDAQVHVSGTVVVTRGAGVLVKGGTLEAGRIGIGDAGTVSVDLGTITGANVRVSGGGTLLLSSGDGSSHFIQCTLTLSSGATLLWDAGPFILDGTALSIESGGVFLARADILTSGESTTTSKIKNAGKIVFDSSQGSSSQMCGIPLENLSSGSLVLAGPVDSPSELRILHSFAQEGSLSLEGGRVLSLAYEKAEFGVGSRTVLGANATLRMQSGEVRLKGKVTAAPGVEEGGLVEIVSATVSQEGLLFDVNELLLRGGGGELHTKQGKSTTTKRLLWEAGRITGSGAVNVGHASSSPSARDGIMDLSEAQGSKQLTEAVLNLFGSGRIRSGNTLLLLKSSLLHVHPGSSLTHEPLSVVQRGDDSAVGMRLDEGSAWRFDTGAINNSSSAAHGSSSSRTPVTLALPFTSAAALTVSGGGEAIFRGSGGRSGNSSVRSNPGLGAASGKFKGLQVEDRAGVRLAGQGNDTLFTFSETLSAPNEGQYILLQNARVEFLSPLSSVLRALALLDSSLKMKSGLELDVLSLGSGAGSSHIEGPGPVQVKSMRFQAGVVQVDEINVSTELLISTSGAKELSLRNFTLLPGSHSLVRSPSQTRLADRTHWSLLGNASLLIEGGSTLYAARPASGTTGNPCLRIDPGAAVTWRGRPGEKASSSLHINNFGKVEVRNSAMDPPPSPGNAEVSNSSSIVSLPSDVSFAAAVPTSAPAVASPPVRLFEVLLSGGVTSLVNSSLSILQAALLTSFCPQNISSRLGCTFGLVSGGGSLSVTGGEHLFRAPVNVTHFSLGNGEALFLSRARVDQAKIVQGELVVHSGFFVARSFELRGGRLSGESSLRSALVVSPGASARVEHNETLSLRGVRFVCAGTCEVKGSDWVLHSGAEIAVSPSGRMQMSLPAASTSTAKAKEKMPTAVNVYAGVGGGGRILNAGVLTFSAAGAAAGKGAGISLRVPVINRGSLRVVDGTSLLCETQVWQDAPSAVLLVDATSSLSRGDSGHLQIDSGRLEAAGTINAHVQLGGRMIHLPGSDAITVNGDVVFSPTASITSHCSSGSSCTALRSNGTVWLGGLAHFSFEPGTGMEGRVFEVIRARDIRGSFDQSAEGIEVQEASSPVSMQSLSALVLSASASPATASSLLPERFDPSRVQAKDAVLMPALWPSLDVYHDGAAAADGGDEALMPQAARFWSESTAIALAAEEAARRADPSRSSQPTLAPPPSAAPVTERVTVREGIFGMDPPASERMAVAMIVLSIMFALGAALLGWYAWRLRKDVRRLKEQQQQLAFAPSTFGVLHPAASTATSTDVLGAASTTQQVHILRLPQSSATPDLYAPSAPPLSQSSTSRREGEGSPSLRQGKRTSAAADLLKSEEGQGAAGGMAAAPAELEA